MKILFVEYQRIDTIDCANPTQSLKEHQQMKTTKNPGHLFFLKQNKIQWKAVEFQWWHVNEKKSLSERYTQNVKKSF